MYFNMLDFSLAANRLDASILNILKTLTLIMKFAKLSRTLTLKNIYERISQHVIKLLYFIFNFYLVHSNFQVFSV